MPEDDHLAAMRNAGLADVEVASRVMVNPHDFTDEVDRARRLEGVIASLRVTAVKPAR